VVHTSGKEILEGCGLLVSSSFSGEITSNPNEKVEHVGHPVQSQPEGEEAFHIHKLVLKPEITTCTQSA